MKNPTDRQLVALANLSRLPDWKVLDEIIEGEREASLESLVVVLDEPMLRRHQGRAVAFKEIRDLVASAQDTLDKIRRRT